MGEDKADIFDHIDIHAPLPRAVDEILLFLKKHAMRGADFSEIRRKDLWSIPVGILREVGDPQGTATPGNQENKGTRKGQTL